jgi:hypothetical protein
MSYFKEKARSLIEKVTKAYDGFHRTIAEGNYRTERSFLDLLTGTKRSLAATTEVAIGATMLDTSKSFGKRMLWASAIAIVSMQGMLWVALGMASIGFGFIGLEYKRARNARKETITEVNFAGQRVEGTRADLCRLHSAQVQIMNLAGTFKRASLENTKETVDDIIASVAGETKRVKVLDGGRYGAGQDAYEFSEPGIKLVNGPKTVAQAASAVSAIPGLKAAWDNKRDAEVVEHLVALQQALPPHIIDEVNRRVQAQRGGPGS